MILLFGGTSETAGLATALAENGYPVLVSTATDAELDVGTHKLIRRRCGRLDLEGMVELIEREAVRLIVDAAHPFAAELHQTIEKVATDCKLPLIRYQRSFSKSYSSTVSYVESHEEAAEIALGYGKQILLTTGSRNLEPYVDVVTGSGIKLFARVLDHPESVVACDRAGLAEDSRIYDRGPFSYEDNCDLIHNHGIGVLVSKDSGVQGGVDQKVQAALDCGCRVVLIRRPEEVKSAQACETSEGVVSQVRQMLNVN